MASSTSLLSDAPPPQPSASLRESAGKARIDALRVDAGRPAVGDAHCHLVDARHWDESTWTLRWRFGLLHRRPEEMPLAIGIIRSSDGAVVAIAEIESAAVGNASSQDDTWFLYHADWTHVQEYRDVVDTAEEVQQGGEVLPVGDSGVDPMEGIVFQGAASSSSSSSSDVPSSRNGSPDRHGPPPPSMTALNIPFRAPLLLRRLRAMTEHPPAGMFVVRPLERPLWEYYSILCDVHLLHLVGHWQPTRPQRRRLAQRWLSLQVLSEPWRHDFCHLWLAIRAAEWPAAEVEHWLALEEQMAAILLVHLAEEAATARLLTSTLPASSSSSFASDGGGGGGGGGGDAHTVSVLSLLEAMGRRQRTTTGVVNDGVTYAADARRQHMAWMLSVHDRGGGMCDISADVQAACYQPWAHSTRLRTFVQSKRASILANTSILLQASGNCEDTGPAAYDWFRQGLHLYASGDTADDALNVEKALCLASGAANFDYDAQRDWYKTLRLMVHETRRRKTTADAERQSVASLEEAARPLLPDLEDLSPDAMPACMARVMEKARRVYPRRGDDGRILHDDRFMMSTQLRALGVKDPQRMFRFVMGHDTPSDAEANTYAEMALEARRAAPAYVYSCKKIRASPPTAGNVMSCPWQSCVQCARATGLVPPLEPGGVVKAAPFVNPAGFVLARLRQRRQAPVFATVVEREQKRAPVVDPWLLDSSLDVPDAFPDIPPAQPRPPPHPPPSLEEGEPSSLVHWPEGDDDDNWPALVAHADTDGDGGWGWMDMSDVDAPPPPPLAPPMADADPMDVDSILA